MSTWQPIDDEAFAELFEEQYAELSDQQKAVFQRSAVKWWKATIRRSELAGDEEVFVVAELDGWVLYFDDVEYGFNTSKVDDKGVIQTPGGSQATLKEVIGWRLPDR